MARFSLGVSAAGALLIILGVLIWLVNRPDYFAVAGTDEWNEFARRASDAYNTCLFAYRYMACEPIPHVPYFTIGGALLLFAGLGLYLFARSLGNPS